ncbi:aromatic-L-amino-acid decarboxylase [Purpureocillium lavendulum]|uniref:Aromatic-L-amino-acid decarboxylase n=1 Tax=Purpureocillium lavendulum TaxID=1247861 RepID=A0AB34G164_9HYPO|nr:aromatic-L-amino-acid decarboxylase [Purpureocillium lavendulum]
MDVHEFRKAAKQAVDQIADYHESVPSRPVVSNVQPGYLRPLLPAEAPLDPEPFADIAADIESKIMPGITHWSSPGFMAFFPCSSSYPAAIAEMCPAATELETVALDWMAQALGLPSCFLSGGDTHGGGVIHGSASEAILTVMVAARDKYLAAKTAHLPEGEDKEEETWRLRSRLVALGSAGAHSSTKKAAQVLGVRFATVPVDEEHGFALQGPALARTLEELAAKGLEPFYLTATLGTTDVCAVDDFPGIADTLAPRVGTPTEIWVHVDAAYAGSALLLDENKPLAAPMAAFHSFNFNPHKWMLTTFDCSAVWVRSRAHLISALSIKPPYLRNQFSDGDLVTDYRDWQIPLGRRFRSLKLWVVLRSYGLRGLQAHVRKGVTLCESLETKLRQRPDLFSVFTPARFALLSLRLVGESEDQVNRRTEALYEQVNAGGQFYLTSTVISGKFAIRVCTGVAAVQEEHVQKLFDVLVEGTEKLVKGEHGSDANGAVTNGVKTNGTVANGVARHDMRLSVILALSSSLLLAPILADNKCSVDDHCMQSDCRYCTFIGDTVDKNGKPGFCDPGENLPGQSGGICRYINVPWDQRGEYPRIHDIWATALKTTCKPKSPCKGLNHRCAVLAGQNGATCF